MKYYYNLWSGTVLAMYVIKAALVNTISSIYQVTCSSTEIHFLN